MGRLAAAAVAGLLALTVAACGERHEPTGPDVDLYPVTVASPTGGEAIVVRRPARRIAVIATSVQRILTGLGAASQVAGTPLAQNGSVETVRLRDLRPDLIVASSSTDDETVAQAARAVPKAPVYQASDDSIVGVERTITDLGLITARQSAAIRLVREIKEKQALVDRRLAGKPDVTVFVDTGFLTTVSNQTLIGDLLREAHARNVAGDAPQVGPFDAKELARLDPRWFLATSTSGTTLAKLRRDPKTRRLRAVRTGRFEIVSAALLSPGPTIGQGLLFLARLLHPDAFR